MEVWGLCPQWGPGAEHLVKGQGGEPPMKLKHLAFRHSMDTANLLRFLKFGNLKNQILWWFLLKKL